MFLFIERVLVRVAQQQPATDTHGDRADEDAGHRCVAPVTANGGFSEIGGFAGGEGRICEELKLAGEIAGRDIEEVGPIVFAMAGEDRYGDDPERIEGGRFGDGKAEEGVVDIRAVAVVGCGDIGAVDSGADLEDDVSFLCGGDDVVAAPGP